jgi:hypothetical protein
MVGRPRRRGATPTRRVCRTRGLIGGLGEVVETMTWSTTLIWSLFLQVMNSSMSGWSTRSEAVPVFAPRRVLPCLILSVEAS